MSAGDFKLDNKKGLKTENWKISCETNFLGKHLRDNSISYKKMHFP